jgi:outer membrane protein OmpA-like peptidoglycan-associated protein
LAKSPVDPESGPVSDDQERQDVLEMEELRRLLAGRERSQIDQLRERLENPELRIKDVSQILAEAIVHRTSQDEKIAKALAPTVEKAIESSIKRNRKVLVDVLFPVMGPAIRKAVASAIHGMIQSFDKTLEYSLSLRGLRWRFEALRTRKPFGEIVLLHTLLYQVEQIFLIHRKSSLVIQHMVSKNVKSHDPDLVAGMLSAIRDFAQDSFSLGKEEGLDTLNLGPDRTIWIEQGPQALLAAVIRGIPPTEFRSTLRETLDSIHLGHGEALEAFDGDSTPLEGVRPDLEDCLQSGYKPKKKKAFPVFWALFGAALALIIILGFFSIRGHRRWQNYLEGLKDVPGIQVTSGEKRSGLYHVYGFRDPLAQDPVDLLKKDKLQPEKFAFHLESYTSTHPQIVQKRFALDLARFESLRKKIEQRYFLFEFDSADMIKGQEPEFQAFVADLKSLLDIAKGLEKPIQVEILGHADSLGTESGNLILSQERAKKILSNLLKEGFNANEFRTIGLGSREPLKEEKTDQDRELNRRVMIRVK